MPNQHNINIVESLTEKLKKASSIYVTDYLGLSVEEVTELRRNFFKNGVEYTVVKNTLAKISAKNADLENIDDMLTGPTAVAITYDDPTTPAKVIKEFNKNHKFSLTIHEKKLSKKLIYLKNEADRHHYFFLCFIKLSYPTLCQFSCRSAVYPPGVVRNVTYLRKPT